MSGQGGPLPPGAFGQSPFGVPGAGDSGAPPPKRSRGFPFGWLIAGVVVVTLGIAAVVTIGALRTANDALDEAQDQAKEVLDQAKGSGQAGKAPTGDLWDASVASGFAAGIDAGIPGEPTRFVAMAIYDSYASAEAQDPARSDHVDRYDWRNGQVGTPSPQPNRTDLEGATFTIDEVPWDRLGVLMAQAEAELKIEDATTRYLLIDHDGADGLVIRAYVSGPRDGGYVQADESATIVTIFG